ncbi:DUF3892 domain-containing protein [Arthrobacter mangrovi]|uniref:DUF3892 domain-containing protein n=1 Tax=Arthrobacter mangrovi TaxID=2966350 RepID=A0ABQ5MZV4_9MICC|nr:DUF3892 domain-containing protein [Arthrobacter mangrovi]GLB69502.1 hypothetical protein AHIS1636_39470 [Arthrobacter mangrovi]
MAVEITHVHVEGTTEDHRHITKYRWVNSSDGKTGTSDKPTMVHWIDVKKGRAYVGAGASTVPVGVIKPDNAAPYLRTYADGRWNNNLLSLPRF